ncbi:MAG: (4Fe-4S)-binding protein [Planctomycetes bacterium DG_58]|nr:MAG: (4Fe-4S)-binding protein [Planctomycetes bacterium DG_58]
MKIAIASGKGGTGKTTIAINLALTAGDDVRLLDCDVEEPNCHIFLNPTIESRQTVSIPVPEVDESKCTGCGACGRICQFSAIVALKTKPLTFPDLCHGCGGCMLVCPEEAIREVPREVGVLEQGSARRIRFVHGRLRVGEAMSPPLIRAVKAHALEDGLSIIDAPPGTSCPVIEAIRKTDFVLLVTEPTPFGLNDLELAVGAVRILGIPFGVVVNRSDVGDDRVDRYCREQQIPILAEIPNDRRVAEAYSRGTPAVEALPEMKTLFTDLHAAIERCLDGKTSGARPGQREDRR